MAASAVARLDPMKNMMPVALLEVAYRLVKRGQNDRYWAAYPEPKPPIGRVPFEVVRQVATFAVPFLGLALVGTHLGSTALLRSLPVAWLVGALLDGNLEAAIQKKQRRQVASDAGRYEAVKWLSEQMGMSRSEITLVIIRKMAADFNTLLEQAEQREAAKRRAEAQATSHRRSHEESDETDTSDVANARSAVDHSYFDHDEPAWYSTTYDSSPSVNIANGLPMNGAFDTAGNAFGFDNTF